MKKTICTATVFLGLAGVAWALMWIELPDYFDWWLRGRIGDPLLMPLVLWIFPHIGGPVLGICLICVLWYGASAICDKLRQWRRG